MSFQPSQPGCAGLGASREPVIPIRAMFDSSCPRLSRASTSRMTNGIKDMDGRDKPGHDEGEASSIMQVGIICCPYPWVIPQKIFRLRPALSCAGKGNDNFICP